VPRKPIALAVLLACAAIGVFFLYRCLGNAPEAAPAAAPAESSEIAAAPKPAPPPALDESRPEADASRADAARTGSELAERTETFPLSDARWVEGKVAIPADAPADETLQVWAFEESAARARSRSEADLPDLVRTGTLKKGWWSRRPVDATGSFRLPLPRDAKAAAVLVDGRFLFLAKPSRVDVAKEEEPLALAPELGAWLVGRCLVPPGLAPEDSPVGTPAEFVAFESSARPTEGGNDAFERNSRVGADLAFELRGVPASRSNFLTISPARLVGCTRSDLPLAGGKKCEAEFALSPGARAEGRVVDEQGRGIAGASVDVEAEHVHSVTINHGTGEVGTSSRGATTNADGSFQLYGIPAGKVRITAQESGYVTGQTDPITLVEGTTRSGLAIALSRGHHVAGTVTWPDGTPARGVTVQAELQTPPSTGATSMLSLGSYRPQSGKTGDRGEFTIEGLAGGPVSLLASAHRAVGSPPPGQENEPGENLPQWTAVLEDIALDTDGVALVLREPVGLPGRVVDDQGAPVKKFAITAGPSQEEGLRITPAMILGDVSLKTQTFEAADGSFLFSGLQPGSWTLTVEAAGYVQVDEPTVQVPRKEDPLVVQLARAAGASGTVVDAGERPIANAEVKLIGNANEGMFVFGDSKHESSTKTDETGAFTIGQLPPGSVKLVASAEGYARSEPAAIQAPAGGKVDGVVLHLRRGGRLTGEVYDAHGTCASGRKVMVASLGAQDMREANVDDAGQFAVENLTPGAYQVMLQPSETEEQAMSAKAESGEEFDPSEMLASLKMTSAQVREGETTHVVLGAPPKAPVRVFGVVSRSHEPVHGGMLTCVGEGGSVLSRIKMGKVKENGEYELKIDEPGSVVLAYQRGISGRAASEFRRTIPAEPEFRLDLDVPAGGIRGTVRGPDGAPIAGIEVDLMRPDGRTSLAVMNAGGASTSDERGRFELQDLAAGTYGLAAGGIQPMLSDEKSVPWGRAIVSGLRVDADRVLEGVEIRLTKPGSISGLVRSADGNPVAGATVFARDGRGELLHSFSGVQTDSTGRFTYRGLAPGGYILCARTKTLASPESPAVPVHEGETASVELVASPGTMLVVSAEDKEGAALHATFSVKDEHGHELAELTDLGAIEGLLTEGIDSTQGRIGPLPPGRYKVAATDFDGRSASRTVDLRGQDERGVKLRIE
jgi:hypothetical protein